MASHIKRPVLAVDTYFNEAGNTDRFLNEPDGLTQLGFGLFGEIGGLLAALKKVSRDNLLKSEAQIVGEEIGDALWYLVSLAHHCGVKPDALAETCICTLKKQFQETYCLRKFGVTFEEIDCLLETNKFNITSQREGLLRRLATSCGNLIATHEDVLRTWETEYTAAVLGNLMAQLAMVAWCFDLKLADIAKDNLNKIKDRWPGQDPDFCRLFDESDCEVYEQLPRQFEIEFCSRAVGTREEVVMRLNGVNIGNPLTDNNSVPDDYRYHDIFHLSYIANLGWSPVIRALLKLKRKSRPKIDENEDGARAIIIEEGIATWIFNHAKARGDFFEGVAVGQLEFGLLKQVRSMVEGYEVAACPSWQWERAILQGFEIFRQMREHKHGVVRVDMLAHLLEFSPGQITGSDA